MGKHARRRHKALSDKVARTKQKDKGRTNPFDAKYNRVKQKVLNTRNISAGSSAGLAPVGRPLASRKRAMDKRSTTLMSELQKVGKSNVFKDRRIGQSQRLTDEEKLARRFVAERIRRSKRSDLYQLGDAQEDMLSHHGQSLSKMEKFDVPLSDSDEEPDLDGGSGLDADYVSRAHFGGDEPENANLVGLHGRTSSDGRTERQRAMEELVKSSKQQKHEQQMQREMMVDKTDELDAQWKSIAGSKALISMLFQSKNQRNMIDDDKSGDGFNALVKRLTFEGRSVKAAERTKPSQEAGNREESSKTKAGASKSPGMADSLDHEISVDDIRPARPKKDHPTTKRRSAADDDRFEVRYGKDGELIGKERLEPQQSMVASSSRDIAARDGSDQEDHDDDEVASTSSNEIQSEVISEPSKMKLLRPAKPTTFKFLEPRLDTNFDPERKHPPGSSKGKKGERKKLLCLYKKEFRGTVRELRKDGQFIARVKLKDQSERDESRKRKTKRLMASLMGQEAEYKKLKRMK